VDINLYCDGCPSHATEEERNNYEEHINSIQSLQSVSVFRFEERIGLAGLVNQFIKTIDTPLILNMQHDWKFVDHQRIDISGLVRTMLEHPEVQVVRFHKRSLPQARKHVDRHYYEIAEGTYEVPLIATDGWGDSPHIASKAHYLERVLPTMDLDVGDDGRYGVEGPMWRAYREDIKKSGFKIAHAKWGSHLYGRFGDVRYIDHLGGAATKWRKRKGVIIKR
jgi:hypothetical protein